MKVNETVGIYEHAFQISPEAWRAQRMQELKDLAEWRQRRMLAYDAWSKPEAVAERRKTHEACAAASLELGRQLGALARAQQEKNEQPRLKLAKIKLTPLANAPVKLNWWRRLLAWLMT